MATEIWLFIITSLTGIIGFVTLLAVAITSYFLKRLINKVDKLESDVDKIEEDIADMKPRVAVLWLSNISGTKSPRQLNDVGLKLLNTTGIKEIVDQKRSTLLEEVKKQSFDNPYDAEEFIVKVMNTLPKRHPELLGILKNGAFKSGQPIDVLLYVGSIYLRNIIFKDLGFDAKDLDLPSSGYDIN